MDFDELKKQAEGLVSEHGGQIEEGVEKAAEFAKGKVSGHDEQIDEAVDEIKGFLPNN
jgi:hypothetical protein